MKNRRRIVMTFVGVILSGIGCGFIKAAAFGTDPFTGFVTGLSQASGIGYGNIYIIVNLILFAAIWLLDRHYIGAATLVNLVGVGYIVQFTSEQIIPMASAVFLRGIFFLAGFFILNVGTSLYFTADLGVSTYDAAALIMKDRAKISLKFSRIGTDLFCVIMAVLLGAVIGAGTVITAFCMGPFIEFFNKRIARPLLKKHIRCVKMGAV